MKALSYFWLVLVAVSWSSLSFGSNEVEQLAAHIGGVIDKTPESRELVRQMHREFGTTVRAAAKHYFEVAQTKGNVAAAKATESRFHQMKAVDAMENGQVLFYLNFSGDPRSDVKWAFRRPDNKDHPILDGIFHDLEQRDRIWFDPSEDALKSTQYEFGFQPLGNRKQLSSLSLYLTEDNHWQVNEISLHNGVGNPRAQPRVRMDTRPLGFVDLRLMVDHTGIPSLTQTTTFAALNEVHRVTKDELGDREKLVKKLGLFEPLGELPGIPNLSELGENAVGLYVEPFADIVAEVVPAVERVIADKLVANTQ